MRSLGERRCSIITGTSDEKIGRGRGYPSGDADLRTTAPRAVDLRRPRGPEIEIVAWATYDFLLSLHVTLASPDFDYADYDIGRAWIESARARCDQRDPTALSVLGRYFGDGRPSSLHATLISLVALCPPPRDTFNFLAWLETLPAAQFAEMLLDQEGLGADWTTLLTTALTQPNTSRASRARTALLARYPEPIHETLNRALTDIEGVRAELLDALRIWDEAVFADERPRIIPLVQREAAILERKRTDMAPDAFLRLAMRGVEWQRPADFRRIIFAPSYFCRPAVYYHFWRGTLTFCTPVESALLAVEEAASDPRAPSGEILHFFEALGDPTRLRILRLLSEREMYLTELADRLGLTKATTKHHMVRLRAAGLVTLYDRDRMTYYALRPDISRNASQLLEGYLGKGR